MRINKTSIIILCALCAALNIVLGTIVGQLKIPLLFLDTIGTIFASVYFGPWYGAAVGATSNIAIGVLFNPKSIPFFIVNVIVGLVVGYISKKFNYSFITALIIGIILSIICPLVGTPISVWLSGGVTGTGNDFLVLYLRKTGSSVFTAAFIPRITGNIVDKITSCILVWALIKKLPVQLRPNKNNYQETPYDLNENL